MARHPRIFLAAGEASGDRYGGMLIDRLRTLSPGARITGVGGPCMTNAGMICYHDMMSLATMGLANVFANFGAFARAYRSTIIHVLRDRPHVLVPIDNPGFNLRVAGYARQLGIPVCYYVSPQVWAWGGWRIGKICRTIDRVLTILPFEPRLYEERGVPADYVGHPMLDYMDIAELDVRCVQALSAGDGPLVGLLPGSRLKEVTGVFAPIARAAADLRRSMPSVRFAVACAREDHLPLARRVLDEAGLGDGVELLAGRTFEIMKASRICIAVSGTATLELTWFRRPMVIVYRSNRWGKVVKRLVLKVDHIGLPNIIAGREIVPEHFLFDDDHTPVTRSALALLGDEGRWQRARADLDAVMEQLGAPGATRRAAAAVLRMAQERRR